MRYQRGALRQIFHITAVAFTYLLKRCFDLIKLTTKVSKKQDLQQIDVTQLLNL